MKTARSIAFGLVFALSANALCWDDSGHRVVGEIAFRTLIAMHSPAVAKLQTIFSSSGLPFKDLATAATVPDQIKRNSGNHSGFPSDPGHKYNAYHFLDKAIPAGAPLQDHHPGKNALVMLNQCEQELQSTNSIRQKAWDVAWIAHLVGDMHQPLHGATHVWAGLLTADHSDVGGNLYFLEPIPSQLDPWKTAHPAKSRHFFSELHAYWDGLVPGGTSAAGCQRVAARLMGVAPMSGIPQSKIQKVASNWLSESYAYAKAYAYTPTLHLYQTPDQAYHDEAVKRAEQRVLLAGYRLAFVLDKWLR